jgi:hypothetical protein
MKRPSAILITLAIFHLQSLQIAGEVSDRAETIETCTDNGVSAAVVALKLNLNSLKVIPANEALEKAFTLELAVRDVTSQVWRFRSYHEQLPAEVFSGEVETLFTKAYGRALRLETLQGTKRKISHAARILYYSQKLDLSIDKVAVVENQR